MISDAFTPVPDRDEGFDSFYRREFAAVLRIAWSLTGRRSVAEEVVQDAFLAAHRNWQRIVEYDDAGVWLRRVTINRALSVLRRRSSETRSLLRLGHERERDSSLPERTDEVWTALRALPRRQAEVLVLVIVEDRAVADVARILDCGEETVRTHLRRGRRRMSELLSTKESTDDDAG